MELILSAFGLSHLHPRDENLFYRMPPVTMSEVARGFMPDFSMLLLCDRLVVDRESFDRLMRVHERDHWAYAETYVQTSTIIRRLHDEGFVRLEDFDLVVESNRSLLEAMLEMDIGALDQWVSPMKESIATWRESLRTVLDKRFVDNLGDLDDEDNEIGRRYGYLGRCYMHGQCYVPREEFIDEALASATKRRKSEYRQALRATLKDYLAYINSNLVLSQHFECGFHDWYDMRPFYEAKFLRIGMTEPPGQKQIDNVKRLFDVSFPELTLWSPDAIVRALQDKRIAELRKLVDDAANGNITFDRDFANGVLGEVLKIERGIAKMRNIVSYATLPLGFIPVAGTPIQKAVEEAVMQPLERKRRREFRWFYLISELAGAP